MTQLETAFTSILGKIPTYMRPPYFATNALVLQTLGSLGYHVIQASIDTLDWENNTPATIGQSAVNFQQGLDAGGTISLEHDVYQTTVETLVPQLIAKIKAKGLTGKFRHISPCFYSLQSADI
jgi:peptidoglycan/xylan/chitin deacetylase (PgdA/CDA1 family)